MKERVSISTIPLKIALIAIMVFAAPTQVHALGGYSAQSGPTGGGSGRTVLPPSDVDGFTENSDKTPPKPAKEYTQQASQPVCNNSTCITAEMISTAKNEKVSWTEIITHLDKTEPGACILPHTSGHTAYKQASLKESRVIISGLEDYDDAFCTQQGCSYVKTGAGLGKCVQ